MGGSLASDDVGCWSSDCFHIGKICLFLHGVPFFKEKVIKDVLPLWS